jgi:hypothetical protein
MLAKAGEWPKWAQSRKTGFALIADPAWLSLAESGPSGFWQTVA